MAINTCRCCPDPGTEAAVDFSRMGSAKGFLERIGVLRALRGPLPRIAVGQSLVHTLPLPSPLPLAELQGSLDGEPPPDRGQTRPWPQPDAG